MKKVICFLAVIAVFAACKKNPQTSDNPIIAGAPSKILDKYFVTSLAFDRDGNTWAGTFKQGLIKYKNGQVTLYDKSNSPFGSEVVIHDLAVDSKGNIWIGADGLIKFDGTNFTKFTSANTPIPEDYVSSIAIDFKDNIWFTSCRFKQGGLVKYDGNAWQVFTPENSLLPANLIQDIAIDSRNNVWLAVSQMVGSPGLVKISDAQWTNYTGSELGFTPYYFSKLAFTSKNQLCGGIDYALSSSIIHNGPQVFIFDGANKASQLNFNNTASVSSIAVDKNDNIWCASSGGLAVYNGQKWIVDSISYKTTGVFTLKQSPDGKMWLGTGNGVYIYN